MLEINKIHQGDCLELMKQIEDKSINLILCDLPYGTTDAKWDKEIDLNKLWKEYKRIIKDNGVVILYGNNLFSFKLASSNREMFKYKYVWIKRNSTLFVHAKNRPLVKHEDILVFSKAPMGHKSLLKNKRMPYNPQGLKKINKTWKRPHNNFKNTFGKRPSHKLQIEIEAENYPTDVLLDFPELLGKKSHPNEKPVELNRFLIKTYSNEGDLVLDNCCGTGSSLVASKQTNRDFIGIEIDENFIKISKDRLKQEVLCNSSPPVQTSNSTSLTSAKQKEFNMGDKVSATPTPKEASLPSHHPNIMFNLEI